MDSEICHTPAILASGGLPGESPTSGSIFNDVYRLTPVSVHKIVQVNILEDIAAALHEARSKKLKVSLAGIRHSQGGANVFPNGIVLDMTKFNKIISFDEKQKILRVQSGATWNDIQHYIHPHGLAVKEMQTENMFTVGGSLGSNVHGRDPSHGILIKTIKSFHLMKSDGSIINVSREENPDWFRLVIGGYGLLGVILDVELWLTENIPLRKIMTAMDSDDYPRYIQMLLRNITKVGLHSARFMDAGKGIFKKLVCTTHLKVDVDKSPSTLVGCVDRNHAMGYGAPPRKYFPGREANAFQEYFIPIDKFNVYMDGLRILLARENARFSGIGVKYVPRDDQSFLPYAKTDSISVGIEAIIPENAPVESIERYKNVSQKIISLALSVEGTFYLSKHLFLYASSEQLMRAYPKIEGFIEKKSICDPDETFSNLCFDLYASTRVKT